MGRWSNDKTLGCHPENPGLIPGRSIWTFIFDNVQNI